MLAFSGRFDVEMLYRAVRSTPTDETEQPPGRAEASQEKRRRLHHNKAEAIARHKEGLRLARHRHELQSRGASQPANNVQEVQTFTRRQLNLLQELDNGDLLRYRNEAVAALGHGRLTAASGPIMDTGGNVGGGSRRTIDSRHPPDWREFLERKYGQWRH